MNLAGRCALVTGGSRGIGRGIALALAGAGADIVANYRRDEAAAETTVAEVRAMGRKAVAYQADVTDYDQVQSMIEAALRTLGKLDILVCNAGIMSGGLLSDVEIGEMHRVINTHFFGAFHCIKAALPSMREQARGDIIIISSRATLLCLPGSGPYVAAKAALEAMVKCLSKEEQKNNIRVNAIAPGLVETEMARRIVKRTMGVDIRAIDAKSPFGRIAQPEDVGNLASFLCSKQGEYISGQVIYVHGGDVRGPYA